MIIATFNVENLFERPRAMNFPTWTMGQGALDAAGELNALINRRVYRDTDRRRMLHLLKKHQLLAARRTTRCWSCARCAGNCSSARPRRASSPAGATAGLAGSS